MCEVLHFTKVHLLLLLLLSILSCFFYVICKTSAKRTEIEFGLLINITDISREKLCSASKEIDNQSIFHQPWINSTQHFQQRNSLFLCLSLRKRILLGSNWAHVLGISFYRKDVLGMFTYSFSFHETKVFYWV